MPEYRNSKAPAMRIGGGGSSCENALLQNAKLTLQNAVFFSPSLELSRYLL
jgi:hypothetical protein